MTRPLLILLALTLSACGLSELQIFPDEYVSDQYTILGVSGSYAVGAEIDFQFHVAEGDTRAPAIEVTGTALRVDETTEEGIHATAVEAGAGEIIYSIGGAEVRRYSFRVRAIEHIAVEHYGVDAVAGFVIEDGVFDPSRFSIAQGTGYGITVRYEDADGQVLDGAGLLSAEGGFAEDDVNGDSVRFDTLQAGESTLVLSAGDATTTITYDVVDAIASITLAEEYPTDELLRVVANAVDAEGRPVYCRPTWRIDGEDYDLLEILPGIALDPGYIVFAQGTDRHIVEGTVLGMSASIETAFASQE
ncbi:MAG: hypothetical protein AB8H86_21690 [Polyangiales bacterium]